MDTGHPKHPVYVTRTVLPPLEEYLACVRQIFVSRWLTNQGAWVVRLEQELRRVLAVPTLAVCANGTLALQLALRLLGLNGKPVITTPFTYVATLSALLWEGCTPIFADIDPETLCLSPTALEEALVAHPDAAGILPVHVFGNACAVNSIQRLAEDRGLKVLYDAAHAFACRLNGQSLFSYGHATTASFHATKLFHTVEGGCVVTPHADDMKSLRLLRAFGQDGETYPCLGINAKMSELHAAMGICLLPKVPAFIEARKMRAELYDSALHMSASGLRKPTLAPGLQWNYAYYPVIFPDHAALCRALTALRRVNIYPRRYFYPSLTRLPYIQGQTCPVSEDIAERILCLPFWPELDPEVISLTAATICSCL